jgi:choline dehydrogenase-like flavoprotein
MIDPSNKGIQSHYDFIVVGAGAAGSVLAAELSASGAQVLIIESGGPDDAPTIMNPSIWFYNVGGPLDYHLPVSPSPRLNNRKFNMALGHVLGGVSIAMAADVSETTHIERPPRGREEAPVQLSRLLDAHQVIIRQSRKLARRASELGDDGTNDLVVSEVLRTNELQVWFLSEHLVDMPLVKAEPASVGAA